MADLICVQADDFDLGEQTRALNDAGQSGAIATFTGLVRDSGDRTDIRALFLEHYPGMTEQVIEGLVAQARERWSVHAVRIIHRIGELPLGAQIVFVGVASAHRADAFAACEFLMDALKTSAPFWKKEISRDGTAHWVAQKASDRERSQNWD